MISLENIEKRFGALRALEDVSLKLQRGEILALVGENGAGKSTLMNVLYGLVRPDSGRVVVDGRPTRLRSPRDAMALGIGMVHQHFMLVPGLSVVENVVLGAEPKRGPWLDLTGARREVTRTCERFGFSLDLDAQTETLTVGSQQKVEIVKALHRGARVLVLDEPTAVLTPQETDDLYRVARALREDGHTVVFVSHKIREVLAVADRVVALRRGRVVGEAEAAHTTPEEIAELMVGRTPRGLPPVDPTPQGGVVLEVERLVVKGPTGRPAVQDVTLDVRAGEIVGLAGVDGNGQSELCEAIAGLRPIAAGSLRIAGRALDGRSPLAARDLGLSHIPEDRLRRGLVGPLSLEENVALGGHRAAPFAKGPWIDFKHRRARARALLADYDVRPPDPTAQAASLSGGNQQKVVLARELESGPRLVLAAQPTRGLDIGAVADVQRRLIDARARGCAVLLVSLDLEELLALSDRLYVIYRGQLIGELPQADFDERKVGRMMLGATSAVYGAQGG